MPHYHVVQENENLSTIGSQYGVTSRDLQECNPELASRRPAYGVSPGDKILICDEKAKNQAPIVLGDIFTHCPRCTVDSAEIRCSHKERTFVLKYPPAAGQVLLLQVIASSANKEKISISYHGNCRNKKRSGCPIVAVDGGGMLITGGSGLKADIRLPPQDTSDEDFLRFFWKYVVIPNQNPANTYAVMAKTCTIPVFLATVAAFPKVEWEGEISAGIKYDTQKDSNFNRNRGSDKLKVNGEWTIGLKIKITYDERKWELEGSLEEALGHYKLHAASRVLFKGMQTFLDKLAPLFGSWSSDYGKVVIQWPQLKVSGGVRNEEAKDQYKVNCVGNVKLSLDPLIGVDIETDILNWIILMCPGGFGPFLTKLKKKLAEGYDSKYLEAKAVLQIILSAKACIKGDIEWRVGFGEGSWVPKEGEVALEIEFKIEGKAEVEIRVFVFKAGAGAEVGAQMTIGARLRGERGEEGPELYGQLYFNGLTVYYSYYYEIGGATLKPTKKRSGSLNDKHSYEHEQEVIAPAQWPEHPKKTPLASGEI